MLGDRVGLIDNAVVNASGRNGGEILIGGDLQGQGDVRTAQVTHVGAGVTLYADAIIDGDGGKSIIWADGHTQFQGALSAKGGAISGNGGFAEVSGAQGLIFAGDVDLTAVNGQGGTLVLDPFAIVIVNVTDGVSDALSADAADFIPQFDPDFGDVVATDLNGALSDGNSDIFAFSENPGQIDILDSFLVNDELLPNVGSIVLVEDAPVVEEDPIVADEEDLAAPNEGDAPEQVPIQDVVPTQDQIFSIAKIGDNLYHSNINTVTNDDIDSLQAAIASGEDPTKLLEATAAGEEEEEKPLIEQPLIQITDNETGLVCTPLPFIIGGAIPDVTGTGGVPHLDRADRRQFQAP